MKLSVVIPYKQRRHNLGLVLEGLANQTMDPSEFEIVVGAMEYSDEYVALCREFTDRLSIVSVLTAREFDIPRARNLGMRQATGEVIVQMDADTLLPPDALRNLYDRHFAFGQNICAVGQVVGYGNNNDGDTTSVAALPYDHHLAALHDMVNAPFWPTDPRFQVDHVIPWAFGWTGLIALPTATVHTHHLYFDEGFRGWGVDDLEWSYRICASRVPIVLCPDVHALHLPHMRDAAANRLTEIGNYRRFLRKWPTPDVELAHAFGDLLANSLFLDYQRELRRIGNGHGLGSARGRVDGRDVICVGVALDDDLLGRFDPFDDEAGVERWPLVGLALPYADASADECRILPAISGFSARYRDAVLAEAARIAKQVVQITE